MNDRSWLDRFGDELARRRLPPAARERLVDELRDHLMDLGEEGDMEVLETRLGEPEALAQNAAVEFGQRHKWKQRLAASALLVGPIPTAALLMYLYLLALVGLGWAYGLANEVNGLSACATLTPTQHWLIGVTHQSLRFVPFVVAAVLFALLARRTGYSWLWAAAASVLVALTAGVFDTRLQLPVEPGTGYLVANFGIGSMLGTVRALRCKNEPGGTSRPAD